jgi:tRNA-2-methylthio-N6-dimethylallyladenosine synthase
LQEVEEGRNAIMIKRRNLWDISPVRLMSNGITALVSITRLRQYVRFAWYLYPWTGDAEPQSIMKEIQDLWDKGFKEITLLWDKTLTVTFGTWRWFEKDCSRY